MRSILITGGTGSFGQAFVQRLLSESDYERIIVYSRGEHAQETMEQNLNDERVRYFIGDVRDLDRLELAMQKVQTVVHAAALKIVPKAEYNPTEAIATNVNGAQNVVKAAIHCNVQKVVALSTDKAVNPVNLYGATKLAAEKVFVAASHLAPYGPEFTVVRYGNVYGSRGSVFPLFKALALKQDWLPLTDARMTRFHITMDQAIDLVQHALRFGCSREIFVPKIPSLRISDVVTAFECEPKLIGIRPGEKIHECLLTEDESHHAVETEEHFIINPAGVGRNLPEQFRYSSGTNTEFLSCDEIRTLIQQ